MLGLLSFQHYLHAASTLVIGEALGSLVDGLTPSADVDFGQVCASVAALGRVPLIRAGAALLAGLACPHERPDRLVAVVLIPVQELRMRDLVVVADLQFKLQLGVCL
jgi:hypothetical protein